MIDRPRRQRLSVKSWDRRRRALLVVASFFVCLMFASTIFILLAPVPKQDLTNTKGYALPWEVIVPPIPFAKGTAEVDLSAPIADWEPVARFADRDACMQKVLELRMSGAAGRQTSSALDTRLSAARCVRVANRRRLK